MGAQNLNLAPEFFENEIFRRKFTALKFSDNFSDIFPTT